MQTLQKRFYDDFASFFYLTIQKTGCPFFRHDSKAFENGAKNCT